MLRLPNATSLLRRFRKGEDGNMSVFFALSAIAVIGAMGAAMDYTTLSNAKARSQSIADAAALTAAIYVRDNDRPPTSFTEGYTEGVHSAQALGFEFKGWVDGGAQNVEVNVAYDDNLKEARVTVSGKTVPTFIQLLGKQNLAFSSESVVSYLDVDSTHPASIVLVLDNSGSMRWDSEQITVAGTRPEGATSRIEGLKTSVRTFRDELRSRIGNQLVADGLRVLRTGILPYNSEIVPLEDEDDESEREMDWGFLGVEEEHITAMVAAGGTNSNPPMTEAKVWLSEEDEDHRLEAIRNKEEFRQPLKFVVFMTDGQNTTGNYELVAESGTGYYYRKFGNIWYFTRKPWFAANNNYIEGRLTLDSDRKTIESCEAMEAEGTIIYTIGYALDVGQYYDPEAPFNPGQVTEATRSSAYSLLTACATKPENFIQASDGNELEGAFDQIQNSIIKELIRIRS